MNPAECLTALISKVKRHRILVYDLESKDGDTQNPGFTRVFLGGVYDGAQFSAFRNHPNLRTTPWDKRAHADGGCIDSLLRYILQRQYRGYYIYAHNGGAFDHLHLLPWLTSHIAEFEYRIIPIQSAIQVLKVTERSSRYTWTFLDSIRLLPMSLEKAATTFGFPGKLTHSLDVHEKDPSWEKYLQRDCEALYQSVEEFQRLVHDVLGGEMGITAPSTAMKLYRRKYMGHGKAPAMIPHHRHWKECDGIVLTDDSQGSREAPPRAPSRKKSKSQPVSSKCEGCLHEWIRRGYYGGRTDPIRAFGEGVSYFDINSSYPRAMLEDMPGGEMKQYGPEKKVEDFERLDKMAIGFVECEVDIPTSCYLPPLPYRHPKTGKLLFPVGRFSGVWPWEELKLLSHELVKGRIVNIKRSVWYGRKTLFFDFVKELYAYRDKSSPLYEEGIATVCKLMLNSSYGKFGMNEDRREILVLAKGEKPPEGATFPRFDDGSEDVLSRVCFIEKRVSPPYIIPQISAQITSLARVRLWRFMASVLLAGGKLYYCDTDSILTDLSSLPTSNALGELKNEYPGETLTVEIVGPKMYMLSKQTPFKGEHLVGCPAHEKHPEKRPDACPGCSRVKLAMKGLPKDERTEANLLRLKQGEKVFFSRLEKLGSLAEKQFREGPKMKRVHKRHMASFDKRTFIDGGRDSVPIVIDERLIDGLAPVRRGTQKLV